MEQQEIWKPIPGYEIYYQINTVGDIKTNWGQNGKNVLKHSIDKFGYHSVSLTDRVSKKQYKVHRLVAQAFIPNPENKPEINHINGLKADNRVENLEWCTRSENVLHSYRTGLAKCRKGVDCPAYGLSNNTKGVEQLDKNTGEVIMEYVSIKEAAASIDIDRSCISHAIKKGLTRGGYKWRQKQTI